MDWFGIFHRANPSASEGSWGWRHFPWPVSTVSKKLLRKQLRTEHCWKEGAALYELSVELWVPAYQMSFFTELILVKSITADLFLYLCLCLGAHVGRKKITPFPYSDSCLALCKSLLLSAKFLFIVFWGFFEGLFAFWSGVTKYVYIGLFLNSLLSYILPVLFSLFQML